MNIFLSVVEIGPVPEEWIYDRFHKLNSQNLQMSANE